MAPSFSSRTAREKARLGNRRRLRVESLEQRRLLAGDLVDWHFDGDGQAGGTVDSAGSATDWVYGEAPTLVGTTGTGFQILSGSDGSAAQNNNVLKVIELPDDPEPLKGNGVLEISNGNRFSNNQEPVNARYNFGAGLTEGVVDFRASFDAGSTNNTHLSQIRLVGGGSVLARIHVYPSQNTGGYYFQYGGTGTGQSIVTTGIDEQFSDFGGDHSEELSYRDLAHHFQISWKDSKISMYVDRVGVDPTTNEKTPLTDVLIKDQPFNNGLTHAPNRIEFYIGSTFRSVAINVDQLRVSDSAMPVIATDQYFDVQQGAAAGIPVAGMVNLVDQVYGSDATFEINGGTGQNLFVIETVIDSNGERRGKITVASGANLNSLGSHTLDVRLADGSDHSATVALTVEVVNETIADRLLATHLNAGYNEAPNYGGIDVGRYITLLNNTGYGKFSSLDYTNDGHFTLGLERLAGMAEKYSKGNASSTYTDDVGNSYSQNELKLALYDGLQYWLNSSRDVSEHTPTHPWEQNQLLIAAATSLHAAITEDIGGSDTALAEQATMLRDSIIEETEKDMRFQTENGNFGGANRAYRYQGLRARAAFVTDYNRASTSNTTIDNFTATGQLADIARLIQTNAAESDAWRTANGPTEDGGFAHHTAHAIQNLALTYGKDWANNTQKAGVDLTGTPWDLDANEYDPVADFFLDSMQWMIHAGQGDLTSVGRNTTRKDEWHDINNSVVGFVNNLLNTAEAGELTREAELIAMRDRLLADGDLVGNKDFWNLDFLTHQRDGYYVSVNTGSDRTVGPESGNGGGKRNFHMNDGVTQILRHGDEYNDTRVVWNWHALPGITAEQRTDALPLSNFGANGQRGDNLFAGSVSDGMYGMSAFQYDKENDYATVNANKGYFFFDDEFVALGSGVEREFSGQGEDIWTTLNQTQQLSAVTYNAGSGQQTIGSSANVQLDFNNLSSPAWFHQDGVGYVIVPKAFSEIDVKLWGEDRTGDWNDLDDRYADGDNETVNVFQLAINHGTNPNIHDTNHYQYVVVPDITAAQMDNYVSNLMPTIISNTLTIQASQHASLGVTQITFYQAGSLQVPGGPLVSVDQPALVMLKAMAGGDYEVSVSDPNHSTSISEINVTLSGHYSGSNAIYDSLSDTTTIASAHSTVDVLAGQSILSTISEVTATNALIESVVVGEAAEARSMVNQVTVNFDSVITYDVGAFEVTDRAIDAVIATSVAIDSSSSMSVVTLTFSGTGVTSGSLSDGNYQLNVVESRIHTVSGGFLDANGDDDAEDDFVYGDAETDEFFRLYGDASGDRSVGLSDFASFRSVFGSGNAADPMVQQFDSNDDDIVSLTDFAAFRAAFGGDMPF